MIPSKNKQSIDIKSIFFPFLKTAMQKYEFSDYKDEHVWM